MSRSLTGWSFWGCITAAAYYLYFGAFLGFSLGASMTPEAILRVAFTAGGMAFAGFVCLAMSLRKTSSLAAGATSRGARATTLGMWGALATSVLLGFMQWWVNASWNWNFFSALLLIAILFALLVRTRWGDEGDDMRGTA